MKVERWQLKQRQGLPLELKIRLSDSRIRDWYKHWGRRVYVAFSGGMDSAVMLHRVRSIYPDVPAVFVRSLPYPEIMEHVKATENVIVLRPEKTFKQVIDKYGWPVVSKRMAQYIGEVQRAKGETATKRLRLTGIKTNGDYSPMGMISQKWQYLYDAPFSISDRCCHWLKKKPFKEAENEFGWPFVGVRVAESQQREQIYYSYGCNAVDTKRPRSWPLAFWTDADIWQYIAQFNVPYSRLYDMGYTRSGCMFCGFGAHLEPEPNRFQRMRVTHPRQYEYAMFKLGMGEILDYIGVEWREPKQTELFSRDKYTVR